MVRPKSLRVGYDAFMLFIATALIGILIALSANFPVWLRVVLVFAEVAFMLIIGVKHVEFFADRLFVVKHLGFTRYKIAYEDIVSITFSKSPFARHKPTMRLCYKVYGTVKKNRFEFTGSDHVIKVMKWCMMKDIDMDLSGSQYMIGYYKRAKQEMEKPASHSPKGET